MAMGTVWASGRSLGFQDDFALFQIVLELNSSQQKLFRTFRPASQLRGLVEAMTTHIRRVITHIPRLLAKCVIALRYS
jgi:hypothetical protein